MPGVQRRRPLLTVREAEVGEEEVIQSSAEKARLARIRELVGGEQGESQQGLTVDGESVRCTVSFGLLRHNEDQMMSTGALAKRTFGSTASSSRLSHGRAVHAAGMIREFQTTACGAQARTGAATCR